MLVDEIMVLRVADLRQKLAELQLLTTGVKRELQNRLLEHFGHQDEEDDDDDESVATAQDGSIHNEILPTGNAVSSAMVNKPWFTLKDVEGSVSKFSGSDSDDVTKWIEELEDCAATVQWNQLQIFVYAKQLLVGAAKSFARSLRDVRNWEALKSNLLEEFTVKLSSAEVHRKLQKRQQKKGESLQEFLYALMEIAKPIKLDDASLIEYFVAGIPDTRANKAMLYQARTIKQLKSQIDAYKKSRGESEQNNKNWSQIEKGDHSGKESTTAKNKKCFKCGDESHLKKDCTKKSFNCFKCDKPGHRAADCRVKVEAKKENEQNANVVQDNEFVSKPSSIFTSSGLELKDIGYAGFNFKGLVDTGADVEFHVIPDEDIGFEAILGRTILEHVDMQVSLNGTQFVQRIANHVCERKIGDDQPIERSSCAELLNEFKGYKLRQSFEIVSDRGAAFTSNLFREYCEARNIQHLMIATGVPRGNGQVERMHKIVVPMLSK
ncbi:hypothetical protein ACLKA6_014588 [Drosophila palustris]